mgnify:CR=1 FL=1
MISKCFQIFCYEKNHHIFGHFSSTSIYYQDSQNMEQIVPEKNQNTFFDIWRVYIGRSALKWLAIDVPESVDKLLKKSDRKFLIFSCRKNIFSKKFEKNRENSRFFFHKGVLQISTKIFGIFPHKSYFFSPKQSWSAIKISHPRLTNFRSGLRCRDYLDKTVSKTEETS